MSASYSINPTIDPLPLYLVDEQHGDVADRVLQSLATVTAWYIAVGQIFAQPAFRMAEIEVRRIYYQSFQPFRYIPGPLKDVIGDYIPALKLNKPAVDDLIKQTENAKVHAEAALMAWTYSYFKDPSTGNFPLVSSMYFRSLQQGSHIFLSESTTMKFRLA